MYSYQIQGNMPSIIQEISTNTREIQIQKERSKDGYKYLTKTNDERWAILYIDDERWTMSLYNQMNDERFPFPAIIPAMSDGGMFAF